MTKGLSVGDQAPDFTLEDQNGEVFRLADIVGKKAVVIYFYPKDFTPGCTEEAYAFRDKYEVFKDAGAEVIGISSDSVESHKRFAKELNLPYILLSDPGSKVRELYHATSLGGIPGRVTFVIDKKGEIRMVFSSQFQPTKHIQEALLVIAEIAKEK
ncbi:MAG: peroxiredoxin [Methanomassiliicoccales archaeon]|nr:peroxiredoxin [Methanomassiliicoccales archaeon]